MKKGLKKFFIICAIAVGAGLLLFLIGLTTGGVRSFDKLADRYEWVNGGSKELSYSQLEDSQAFNAIQVRGNADVVISQGEQTNTRIGYTSDISDPELYVENGVLIVNLEADPHSGFGIDLEGNGYPVAEIYCPEGIDLTDIHIEVDYGDVTIHDSKTANLSIDSNLGDIKLTNVSFDSGSIATDGGDVEGTEIISGGLVLDTDLGDCDLNGTFTGTTQITTDGGDVDLNTSLPEEQYTVFTDISGGELKLGSNSFDWMDREYNSGNGPNIMKITSDIGDVQVVFGH